MIADTATPFSGVTGMAWPALPPRQDVNAFALLFQLEQSQWWSADDIFRQQLRQAQVLAVFAAQSVPFYKSRLGDLRAKEPGALTAEMWRSLPILSRAEVQEAGDALYAPEVPKKHGRRLTYVTSGSTGRPVRIVGTALAQQFRQALRLRGNLWHKRDYAGKAVSVQRLTDDQRRLMQSGQRVGWARGYPTGPMLYRDIAGPIDDHLAWLAAENPDYLITYATSARAFAERAAETGVKIPGLKQVETNGEPVGPEVREACRKAWGVPVVDTYSAREIGPIGLQCPDHAHYHVQAESALVEILDEDGVPCPPGAAGRMVVTPLHNFATPLIRYEIGDLAEAGAPCPCGRGLPVITRVLGRERNMVTLPDGTRAIVQLDGAALSRVEPVRQIQMVQRRLDEIEVKLVVTRELDRPELTRLRNVLVKGLGHPFALRVSYVAEIPRAASGKYEDFRSEIERSPS